MKSLRRSLALAGKKPPIRIPSELQTHPGSLKEITRILDLPKPNVKTLEQRTVHSFTENDAQGLAYAYGNVWFLSSQNRIFKYSIEGSDLFRPVKVDEIDSRERTEYGRKMEDFDHFGDSDYFDGLVFVPVEHESKRIHPMLLVLSAELELVGYSWLHSRKTRNRRGYLEDDFNAPWCAVNPWNGFLYVSGTGAVDSLCLYDVSKFYDEIRPNRSQWGGLVSIDLLEERFWFFKEDGVTPGSVDSIQGAAFSKNGRLYVSRYRSEKVWTGIPFVYATVWHNFIHVYSALTGELEGASDEFDFGGKGDEIEGISVHPSGIIYAAVAENDLLGSSDSTSSIDSDEFEIHAFKYSDTSFPV